MPKFQIVSPHEPSECLLAMEEMLSYNPELLEAELLGCDFGDHTGYVVVEALSEEEARSKLPTILRKKAKVVAVELANLEEVRASHDMTT